VAYKAFLLLWIFDFSSSTRAENNTIIIINDIFPINTEYNTITQ
jgi:hypothetical protein